MSSYYQTSTKTIKGFEVEEEPDASRCMISLEIAKNPVHIIDKQSGRIVGNAVYDEENLNAWFARSKTLPCFPVPFDQNKYEVVVAVKTAIATDTFMLKQLEKAEKLLLTSHDMSAPKM